MGYCNRDKRLVRVSPLAKTAVRRMSRRALKRELRGEHPRRALAATRRGWWYA